MAHFDQKILEFKLKLAETALLFYKVTDVPLLPKTDQYWVLGIGMEENVAPGMVKLGIVPLWSA